MVASFYHTGQRTDKTGFDTRRHLVPSVVLKAITNGTVQFYVGIIQVIIGITHFTRLSFGFFKIGVEAWQWLRQVSFRRQHPGDRTPAASPLQRPGCCCSRLVSGGHLFQRVEDSHRAVAQLLRHLLSVYSQLSQCITRGLGHQTDILDTHHVGVHVLVGKDAAFRVLDDGHQLRGGDASISESRSILLNHRQQLRSRLPESYPAYRRG